MGDDPASRLLHRSYLELGHPSQRTAFPGDFAEFLSRSPLPSGSNCRTRHPPWTDPSPKLLFFFYRRSDKVWGMTSRLSHHTGHTRGSALHRTALPGDFAEFLSRPTSTEGRRCGSGEAGRATDAVDGGVDRDQRFKTQGCIQQKHRDSAWNLDTRRLLADIVAGLLCQINVLAY